MLSFFRRKNTVLPASKPIGGVFLVPETAASLLNTPRRRQLLENIWQRTSLSRKQFETLYLAPLESYAVLVQQLPASENHHHAYQGGMLDHGLEIVAYALKIRQMYLLPIGAPPESQAAQAEAWSAGAAYGALLHDLGKIAVDVQVELQDGKAWHPWHGPLDQPYRFRYVKGRNYKLHSAAAGLVYAQVLPPEAMDWLSGFPELWSQLIFALAGQYEHADILGEIVSQADQASVAQELGGNPARAMTAPKQSLQRQLAEGLRMLVAEKFKLNQPDGPSDGWLTQDALWLVSKPAVDQLRAHLLSQGIEHIPSSNAPMFNLLQDQAIIQTNAQDKAIWKATIDNGRGWKNTFTLLKISPALIWPQSTDRPASYEGKLTIEQAEGGIDETSVIAEGLPSDIISPANDIRHISDLETPSIGDNPPELPFQSDLDPLDDLLALFPDTPKPPLPAHIQADAEIPFEPEIRPQPRLQQPKHDTKPTETLETTSTVNS